MTTSSNLSSQDIPQITPGQYVVAVSGGVDSMVLLDILRQNTKLNLVVAHLDHGIRPDSANDAQLVQDFAMSHNITFEKESVHLGEGASEEAARHARYNFLRQTMARHHARAIIMAHHQDDLLETAIINLLRGTGRRGLTSLASHPTLLRPLLGFSKQQIINYATQHQLPWHEDSTNQDQNYLRNYVRQNIVAKFDEQTRQKWLQIIVRQSALNEAIDTQITHWLSQHATVQKSTTSLPRYQLVMLPPSVAYEIFQQIVKDLTGKSLQRKLAKRAILFCKTAKSHKQMPLGSHWQLRIVRHEIIVEPLRGVVS